MRWTLIMAFRPTELDQPIPEGVTYLDLSRNELWRKTDVELVTIMRVIPQSVTSLDLGFNFLGGKNGAELAAMMGAIPPSVTSLNLGLNHLGRKTGAELVAIMRAIPQLVTSLNLDGNDLGLKTGAELVAIMRAIPPSVTTLNLSWNVLGEKTVEELEQISRFLPYVINIDCKELAQEKLTALNRYNGHGVKAKIQVLTKESPLQALPLQESPPQDAPWLNRYRVGAFFSIASAIAEVIILLACDIAIKTTLMWAGVIGCPIVLGVIAAVGFYLLFEPNSNQFILSATV